MEQEIATQVVGLGGATDFSLWQLFLRADFVVKSVILILIASSIFSLSSVNPGAIKLTKLGIKSSTSNTKKNKLKNNKLNISLANLFDLDLLLTNSEV